MYLPRLIETKVKLLAQHFKVVLVNGPRQVGKSTLLRHLFSKAQRFVFDPAQDLHHTRQDPDLFLKNLIPPVIFDEIQFAPEILPALKRYVDERPTMGQFFLTGSQNLAMLKSVSESLAGRVGIISLGGMTAYEQEQKVGTSVWLDKIFDAPQELLTASWGSLNKPLYQHLWRGQFPGTIPMPDELIPQFYRSYLETYVERDIRLMADIGDIRDFSRFMILLSALSGQEINYSELGRELGISPPTSKKWCDLLTHSFQWIEIPPFTENQIKLASKKGKGYMRDTGFICALNRISSSIALSGHPSLGHMFETLVINIILSLAEASSMPPHLSHWRSHTGAEVDLILERDGILIPIEIKCKTTLLTKDLRGLKAFRDTYSPHRRIGKGFVIYAGDRCFALNEDTIALPWDVCGG